MKDLINTSDQLIIQQQVKEWGEVLVNWETVNRYKILDSHEIEVGFVAERHQGFMTTLVRQFLFNVAGRSCAILFSFQILSIMRPEEMRNYAPKCRSPHFARCAHAAGPPKSASDGMGGGIWLLNGRNTPGDVFGGTAAEGVTKGGGMLVCWTGILLVATARGGAGVYELAAGIAAPVTEDATSTCTAVDAVEVHVVFVVAGGFLVSGNLVRARSWSYDSNAATYDNLVFEDRIYSVADSGETIWIEAEGRLNVATTGKPYENRYVFKLKLDGEKIASITEYTNVATLARDYHKKSCVSCQIFRQNIR